MIREKILQVGSLPSGPKPIKMGIKAVIIDASNIFIVFLSRIAAKLGDHLYNNKMPSKGIFCHGCIGLLFREKVSN